MRSFSQSAAVMVIFGSLVLAGCVPQTRARLAPAVPVAVDPAAPTVDPNAASLTDREPDTCKAADHVALLGQPTSAVALAGITKQTRIIAPGMIIDQEEYDSGRVNFYLNGEGIVVRMNCG